jgi:propanol-preferring alcohol dehydrogenase
MAKSIPILQQAAVVQNPGQNATIAIKDDVPVGSPELNEVLVKLTCTGLW